MLCNSNNKLLSQAISDSIFSEFKVCIESEQKNCNEWLIERLNSLEADSTRFEVTIEVGNWMLKTKGPDSSLIIFKHTFESMQNSASPILLGKLAERMGACHLYKANYDEAYNYYEQQLDYAKSEFSKEQVGRAQVNIATVLRAKGDFDKAVLMYQESLKAFEDTNAYNIGFPNMQLGVLFGMQGQNEKSIDYFHKALFYLRQTDKKSIQGVACVNLANTLLSDNQIDSARIYLKDASAVFEEANDIRSLVNAKTQLARSYFNEGKLLQGEKIMKDLEPLVNQQNLLHQKAYNNKLLAEVSLSQKKIAKSLDYALKALEVHKKIGVNEETASLLALVSNIYEQNKDYVNALEYLKQSELIQDSLFVEEKQLEIENLEAKFQGEKKSKEIEILKRDKAIAEIKRSRILLCSIFLGFLMLSIIIYVITKARHKQKLLASERNKEKAEKELFLQKNISLQKDVDLKNNEIISNALVISKKNQLLERIKDGLLTDDNAKLSKLIEIELEGNEDWDNFLSSFKQANPKLISRFLASYPELSKTDIRLICLMKMNLNSKEIASVLNITPEGIKKARYRLRKKMNLESEIDTQKFILSF